MSDEPTLKSIDTKLTMFMSSQERVNDTVSKAIEQMAKTASKSDSQQVEMNGQSERINELSHRVSAVEDKTHEISEQVVVNKVLVGQTQDLKKMFTKSMVGVFFMFLCSIGASVYSTATKGNSDTESLKQIAELLKANK